jgi:hypothetical protein
MMGRGFITPVALATNGSDWTKVRDPETNADAVLVFDNPGAVAFEVSCSGGATAESRQKSFTVQPGSSYTTPLEVDLSAGIWIRRVGSTDVSNAELSGQY